MNFVKGEKVRVEDGFGKYYAYFNFIFDNSKVMLNTQKTLTGSDILVNIENVYKVNSRRAK